MRRAQREAGLAAAARAALPGDARGRARRRRGEAALDGAPRRPPLHGARHDARLLEQPPGDARDRGVAGRPGRPRAADGALRQARRRPRPRPPLSRAARAPQRLLHLPARHQAHPPRPRRHGARGRLLRRARVPGLRRRADRADRRRLGARGRAARPARAPPGGARAEERRALRPTRSLARPADLPPAALRALPRGAGDARRHHRRRRDDPGDADAAPRPLRTAPGAPDRRHADRLDRLRRPHSRSVLHHAAPDQQPMSALARLPFPLLLFVRTHASSHGALSLLALLAIATSVAMATGLEMSSRSVEGELERTATELTGAAQISVSAGDVGIAEALLADVASAPGVRVAAPVLEASFRLDGGLLAGRSLRVIGIDLLADPAVRTY